MLFITNIIFDEKIVSFQKLANQKILNEIKTTIMMKKMK